MHHGTPVSPHQLATLLQKCIKSKSLKVLKPCKQIHALLITSNINNSFLLSKLVAAYTNCNCLASANSLFQNNINNNLNIFAFNSIISYLSSKGFFKQAFNFFHMLQTNNNLVPNNYTYSYLLKCCVGLKGLNMGQQVHCLVCKYGLCFDLFVANGLIDMYCKCGSLSYARKLFDEMPERDVVTWTNMISGYSNVGKVQESRVLFERMGLEGLEGNEFTWSALITGYARVGDCDEAFSLFRKMSGAGLVPDVAIWNAMISGFVQSREMIKGVELFRDMLVAGVKPNPGTITGLLPALGSMGKVTSGKEIHGLIYRKNMYNNVFVASALIDMYSKCGCVKHARNVFDTVSSKNVASWNAMIGCYGKHGMVNSAFELLDQMEDENVKPNQVTLTCVLASCSHGGMVNKGLTFFKSMRETQRVEISEEHYGCVIDMLCRSGKIEEAYDLLHQLDTEVTDSMVGSFLNGCVVYDRPDLAKKLAEDVRKMENNRPGGLVTLSNIYAGDGEWEKVEMLREVMKVQGVQKLPGVSSFSKDI